ncbi:HTH-type transcriptional regulator AdhR [BD1-7 clade bacterium]|uniref:HTH-type transcriptional regulator AdhR n=1 Tax=BD1-7 clade bacterium TaxID=2029982 RepID=A0A5S9PZ13_9GAMM|nr:HTH-type transcriptional regulator AdhR [BD1-7 clade bacterium]CAA0110264.1 HTH-type transcriptional regulator AdhR [BD1-7 clade bacterium]
MIATQRAIGEFMLTVTQLARKFNISRATILYYEREGLLMPTKRSDNGYRWYGESEIERLEAIVSYRSYGVPVASINELIERKDSLSQTQILKDHFNELEKEINQLRNQQKAIVALLQEPNLLEDNMVTKDRWVEIMKAAGFDEKSMLSWHQKFEEMEPEEHQKFLESLGIDEEEIKQIRSL